MEGQRSLDQQTVQHSLDTSPTDAHPVDARPVDAEQMRHLLIGLGIGLLFGLIAGGVFGVGLGWMTAMRDVAGNTTPQIVQAALPQPIPTPIAQAAQLVPDVDPKLPLDGARSAMRMGKSDAPVQLVVFEDPQCPFCRKMTLETLNPLLDTYMKAGQVSLTYRHYIFLGAESTQLAMAMECAAQADRFWAFHDLAFAEQLPEHSGQINTVRLTDWAKRAGITDLDGFGACLSETRHQVAIDADNTLAGKLGVRGTPTLFVNGKRLVGAVPMEFVRSAIDDALRIAQAGPVKGN